MADIHSAMLRSEFSAWRVWNMRSVALSSATNRFAGSMVMGSPASSVGCPLASISRDFVSLRVDRGRRQLLADEIVDRLDQQAPVLREVLRRARQAAGHDHGRLIVGAELLEHEPACELTDVLAAQRRHVIVVEHDQIEPAVEDLLVDRDVRFDRQRVRTEIQRLARPRVRNVDHAERLHLLRLAVLEHLKIFLLQPADEVPVSVDHAHVFFDVVDLDLERDFRRRRRRGLCAAGWVGACAAASAVANTRPTAVEK